MIVSSPCPSCGHVVVSISQQSNNESKVEHVVYCRTQRISGGH